jgi:superfamily II DNA or RNA helicase
VLEELAHGDVNVLVSVEMLSVGFDDPSLEGVILDFSTKSYTKYSQAVARADRPYGTQKSFVVLDFGDNVQRYGRFEADPAMSLWHNVSKGGVAPTKVCPTDRPDHTGKIGCGRLVPVSMMVCPWCKYEWLTDKQVYITELELLVENKNATEMTITQWAASKKLEGWGTQRILTAAMIKNSDNMKRAFSEAIKVLRTDDGKMISPQYYYFIKKYIIDKKKKK